MKHPIIILFLVALTATITWFGSLSVGRTKATGNDTDAITGTIFGLVTASMAFLGETLLSKYTPVQRLTRQKRLLQRRIKRERNKVTTSQQRIISIEKLGFGHDEALERHRAAHRIARDHTLAERPPCAK